jgi:hypothetical protein
MGLQYASLEPLFHFQRTNMTLETLTFLYFNFFQVTFGTYLHSLSCIYMAMVSKYQLYCLNTYSIRNNPVKGRCFFQVIQDLYWVLFLRSKAFFDLLKLRKVLTYLMKFLAKIFPVQFMHSPHHPWPLQSIREPLPFLHFSLFQGHKRPQESIRIAEGL